MHCPPNRPLSWQHLPVVCSPLDWHGWMNWSWCGLRCSLGFALRALRVWVFAFEKTCEFGMPRVACVSSAASLLWGFGGFETLKARPTEHPGMPPQGWYSMPNGQTVKKGKNENRSQTKLESMDENGMNETGKNMLDQKKRNGNQSCHSKCGLSMTKLSVRHADLEILCCNQAAVEGPAGCSNYKKKLQRGKVDFHTCNYGYLLHF